MTMNEAGGHKVLGLGGVFIRARDPAALAAWYREHLGFEVHDFGGGTFGAIFKFSDREPGYQLWSAFPAATSTFGSAAQPQMLNFPRRRPRWAARAVAGWWCHRRGEGRAFGIRGLRLVPGWRGESGRVVAAPGG
jgi:catechol 2,3-dioxygenase-like lactoylglutathione lyase family enzyme